MKLIENLNQGSAEWHAHRATHFNASDAPAMLNISPYKTRDQLLREKATGLVPEVDEATQRRFDDGHRFEALARTQAEVNIGEDLFPCVGVLENTKLSASFDGLTMDETIVWEHKTLNETLRNIDSASQLPEHYRAQLEQQLLVSGAEKALFTATAWTDDGELTGQTRLWYTPDMALRQRIIDGWAQFERDLADYQPEPLPAPKPAGRAPELLPALHVQVQGSVVASNVAEFKQQAFAVLDSINRDLQTDEDFADAESTIKWCKQAEQKIAAAKDHVQGQMADVDAVLRALDEVSAHARNIRLELDKLVKVEKENRKLELVETAKQTIFDHCAELEVQLLENDEQGISASVMPSGNLHAQLAAAIKGMRSLESMQSALSAAVAEAKIAADARFRRIQANIALFAEFATHKHLFPDAGKLVQDKSPDDLRNLIAARVAEAQRAERERQTMQGKENAATLPYESVKASEVTLAQAGDHSEHVLDMVRPDNDALIKLGEINTAIAPLAITADGLAQLGFVHVATDKAARLYRAADFPRIRSALIQHLAGTQLQPIDRQAA